MSYARIEQLCTELERKIHQLDEQIAKVKRPAEEEILDDVDLCRRLNVSKRTTATWRECRMLKFSIVRGKIYYLYADVLLMLKHNAVPTIDGTLKIKLHRNSN